MPRPASCAIFSRANAGADLDSRGLRPDIEGMSLPPGFLDELRARLSIGQVVGRKVMWDNRKSNPGKGDLWAPCPFHQEKTASFHVEDAKGFYYCFGCHAKGDAITFVRETENVSFMEAVEILAREAGLPMPERDPQAQEKADHRQELTDVMEQAVQWFRMQLRSGAAAEARDYLAKRGLDEAAQARWDIGFAPDQRQGVFSALTGKGVRPEQVIDCGLAAVPDNGGAPYDRFRGRIIFPIRDARGRAIALGGRAMDPNARAKYLNSPETTLFDKGRSLYNHKPAREAAGKGTTLVVSEGYMDTIALVEAGFGATVAPLGTAITEDQLALMWRMSPEPVIALDGDKAGVRAAMRLIDLALPLLEAGKSLRFAMMPSGMDPDDLIQAQGRDAMSQVIEQAVPLVRLLWQRETEGRVFDSPERKAGLEKSLREATAKIADPTLRGHYDQELKDLRWQLFNPRKGAAAKRAPWRKGGPAPYGQALGVTLGSKASPIAGGPDSAEERLREMAVLAILITNPEQIAAFEFQVEGMECIDLEHTILRDAILACDVAGDMRAQVADRVGAPALENLFAERHVQIVPAVMRPGDTDVARLCLTEAFARLNARRGHARELSEAIQDISLAEDERLTHRLNDGNAALDRAARGDTEDRTEYATGDNGAKVRRDEKDAFSSLLDGINFGKSENGPTS